MAAPSANAKDPWEIIVVQDPATRAAIADGLPYGRMLADAAVGFVVCGDLRRANGQQLSYLLQDCSAAVENLLIAAFVGLHYLASQWLDPAQEVFAFGVLLVAIMSLLFISYRLGKRALRLAEETA